MDLVSQVLKYANEISIVGALALAVLAFMRGWIVPGPTHDRVVKERDKYLDMATEGMQLAKFLSQKATIVAVDKKEV